MAKTGARTRRRGRSSSSSSKPHHAVDEDTIGRIRERLRHATEISEGREGSLKAPCGHAYFSLRDNAWHVKHCPRGGNANEIATLHLQEEEERRESTTRSKSTSGSRERGGRCSRGRPSPPVELVECLFMAEELRVGLAPTRKAIEGTPLAEERNSNNIRSQKNLFWISRWGEEMDVSGLLAAVPESADGRPLLSRILGSELWDADEYKGWVIRNDVDNGELSSNPMTQISSRSTAASAGNNHDPSAAPEQETERCRSSSESSTSSSLTKSILGMVEGGIRFFTGNSSSDKRHGNSTDTTTTMEPPASKKRKLNSGSGVGVVQAANNGNLKPPPAVAAARKNVARVHLGGNGKTKTTGMVSPARRPPALDYTSASDHTTDEEDHKEDEKQPSITGTQVESPSSPSPANAARLTKREAVPSRKSKRSRQGKGRSMDPLDSVQEAAIENETKKGASTVVQAARRSARSHGNTDAATAEEQPVPTSEHEQPARISARLRQRAAVPIETGIVPSSNAPQTCRVRIKLKGMKSLGFLEAAISDTGISKKRRRSELEAASTADMSPEAHDLGASSTATPFVLSTTNRLSTLTLATQYDEVSCKRHDSCYPLRYFADDASAKTAVHFMWNELEDLNSKFPVNEEDEHFLAEQVLRNRTAKIMNGRRSQERSIRNKEKEQAEQLVNKLRQNEWANKKKPPSTVEDLELKEIVDRPVIFQGAQTRRTKTVAGEESCPCSTTATRGGTNDQALRCRLCSSPTESESAGPIPVKNRMPLVRKIDVDAADFLLRDDADSNDHIEDGEGSKSSPAATRGSKRMQFDPLKRQETLGKLSEAKYSMDFVEQYNAGLLEEITK